MLYTLGAGIALNGRKPALRYDVNRRLRYNPRYVRLKTLANMASALLGHLEILSPSWIPIETNAWKRRDSTDVVFD